MAAVGPMGAHLRPPPPIGIPCLRLREAKASRRARHCRRPRAGAAGESESDLLDKVAADFARGLDAGMSPDEVLDAQLGKLNLSQAQEGYRNKIKMKLLERVGELRQKQRKENRTFELGKLAYSRGQYDAASKLFQNAVAKVGANTLTGGEAQLWLALAYQALGKEDMCLELYKDLKENHDCKSVRKQATSLLFIMEAPKLKISSEEKVKIPVLSNLERATGRARYSASASAGPVKRRKYKQSFEEKFWENYKPPIQVSNKYVWAASAMVLLSLAWYSTTL
ncbi:unnamed protein product [Ostreobium quekettii]|uniref:Uncharacterized protein n=1 Tax=Ostreobium quekettii TaxID=121088 RepID=A0A8S1J4H9_9CHLO|nr:unnamed protein product [Ostreobium quekettii]|eukprot:evm.model.scf_624.4 EVM.evm.TU.scf_624.4   scf_624:25604-29449(+)